MAKLESKSGEGAVRSNRVWAVPLPEDFAERWPFLPAGSELDICVFNRLGLARGVQILSREGGGRAEDPFQGIEGWAGSLFPLPLPPPT